RRFHVEIQPQLVLLQKTLLNIEGLGRQLDPELDLWSTAKPFLEQWMQRQVGWPALMARSAAEAGLALFDRPLRRGLVFGVTNPKGYPVAVGMFAALLGPRAAELDFALAPSLVGASMAGGALAALLLVAFAGLPAVRGFYQRRERLVTRAAGILFLCFGAAAIAGGVPGLLGRRA
ncbi:MAG: hypothetical protein ACO3CS_18800, partial [Alphaproteobacteria bacterium]